uniref:Uncharacterized protein n=1 Tax=Meloidogyne incognita TaxID=6306 RepID=A0A914MHK3_MELIC
MYWIIQPIISKSALVTELTYKFADFDRICTCVACITDLFSSLLLDSLLGIVIINSIPTEWQLIENFWKIVFLSIEQLENVINWLTQNPAGLKLNDALNTFLSNFFLYHIHLWKCKEQHI